MFLAPGKKTMLQRAETATTERTRAVFAVFVVFGFFPFLTGWSDLHLQSS